MNRPDHGGNLAWAATIAGCPASSLLDFSASINPLGPPSRVLSSIQTAFAQICHYPDPHYSALRSQLGQYHSLDAEWVLPGNGSAELLTLAGRFLADLSQVVIIAPAFGDYYRSLKSFDLKIISPHWDIEQPFCLEHLQPLAIANSGLILNNPHNPTGSLWQRADILPLLKKFRWVIIDEAFMDFLSPQLQQSLMVDLADYPNLIILRSLTKFYSLPGLRLGYALGHPDLLKQWQQWRDPWPVNVLAEAAAIAAVKDQDFQQQTWDWLPPAQEYLYQELKLIPGLNPLPSAANFLLVKTAISATDLQQQLLKHYQLLIRDCLSFTELGDRFFRVAVRTQVDNQKLIQGLQNIYCYRQLGYREQEFEE